VQRNLMKRSLLRVLAYHRVIEPTDASMPNPSLISATPADFERQMRFLAERYRVVSAEEVLDALRLRRPLPERAVLLTFDDAYRDFGEIAWPILRRYRMPSTVFVATAYPGHSTRVFWWDRLYRCFASSRSESIYVEPFGHLPSRSAEAVRTSLRTVQAYLKTLPHTQAMQLVDRICSELDTDPVLPNSVLTWAQLRELSSSGVTVAAHTRTHPALTQVSEEEMRSEIRASLEDVRREIGAVCEIFCYPFGIHDDQVVKTAREEGVQLAFTCIAGQNRIPGRDLLRLQRTNISRRTNPVLFSLRLRRSVSYVETWRQRWKSYNSNTAVPHVRSDDGAAGEAVR
jgi:peptidoglycan/xylan/chitin deacetylase (PgdA/CDA1 family)